MHPSRPETFPLPDDPMFRKGILKDRVDAAKADFSALSEEDIERAFEGQIMTVEKVDKKKLTGPQKMLEHEALATTRLAVGNDREFAAQATARKQEADAATEAVRATEASFKERYGIDLRAERQPFGKRVRLALLSFGKAGREIEDYGRNRTTARHAREEQLLMELATRDPAAYAAIDGTQRGIRDLEMSVFAEYRVSPDPVMNDGAAKRRYESLLRSDPTFVAQLRKYREAFIQLGRLKKENGIGADDR